MYISRKYKIEEREQKLTLEIIKSVGYEDALEVAYCKTLYLIANSPDSTLATELLAWSHNLLEDSRKVASLNVAADLRLLSTFYRKLAHKLYWYLKGCGQLSDIADFVRLVE